MRFDFGKEKNEILLKQRGITFYKVIETIAEKGILLNFDNPNKEKYPNQKIFVVEIDKYTYCIPYEIIKGNIWFLKTIYPSRKFKYLIEGGKDG